MKKEETQVGILGMGFYFPKTIVDSKEEADRIGMAKKLYQHIGVDSFYLPSDYDHPSEMAFDSAKRAIEDADIAAEEIDLIIVSVFMNDYLHWQMSAWLKNALGASNAMTMEVKGGCAANFQAVEMAVDQIRGSTDFSTVLVTSSERLNGYGWPTFLSSGSQSIILRRNCKQFNYLGFKTINYIIHHDMAIIPNGGTVNPFSQERYWNNYSFVDNVVIDRDKYLNHIKPIVFDKYVEVTELLLKSTGHKLTEINYMISLVQQKNMDDRILDALKAPDMPNANEFKSSLGHFSGADIYILLDKARKQGKIKRGDLILIIVIGGVSWFTALLRY